MSKVIIIQNGHPLNSPVGFDSDPQKANAPGKGAFTGSTGTQQTKATSPAIVAQHRPSDKEFSTLQAQAARAGFELTTSHHDKTGLTLWQVARWGQSRQFSEWGDVCNFIAHIGGFRHG
jgi:hypothetical protein